MAAFPIPAGRGPSLSPSWDSEEEVPAAAAAETEEGMGTTGETVVDTDNEVDTEVDEDEGGEEPEGEGGGEGEGPEGRAESHGAMSADTLPEVVPSPVILPLAVPFVGPDPPDGEGRVLHFEAPEGIYRFRCRERLIGFSMCVLTQVVVDVRPGTEAHRLGLQPGWSLERIDDIELDTLSLPAMLEFFRTLWPR